MVDFSAQEQITGKKDDLEQLTQLVAIDVREHFGEKVERPKPVAQPQPQAPAPAPAPAAPQYPYETLDTKNPLGIVVKQTKAGVNVVSVAPDSPCDFLKPNYIIQAINARGPLPEWKSGFFDNPYKDYAPYFTNSSQNAPPLGAGMNGFLAGGIKGGWNSPFSDEAIAC